ncbi:unnamed protein product [Adineta ricciae]|uniref:Transposase n=1 Tax=Adineta ricciae TaxID=249248 RepID=A0A815P6V1_ADIRI|nr:unnamed protein product [Adineta ricciae]CAF1535768.1 unnamed protein product [Adineta ricciae]
MAKSESPTMVIRELQRQGFLETGSVQDLARTGRSSTITEEKIEKVEEVLEDEPLNTIRNVTRDASITKHQAHRIMREILGYKPYKMHSTQNLYDGDMDLRVEMAEHLIPMLEDAETGGNIFFSDESTFYISGLVNKHNCRVWAENNPYITMESAMKSAKVNVWCAMSNKEIIGLYFFGDKTVNQHNYLDMLKNYVYSIIQRKRLTNKIIFQQHGAPPHFLKEVCAWLNEKLDDRWLSRGGSISWAPRSPDLTPLDFYLWGYIKTSVNDIDDLKGRIEREIKAIKKRYIKQCFRWYCEKIKILY